MGIEQKIYIAASRIAGRGVYAKRHIKQEEPILRFRGDIITLEQALARPVDGYPLQVTQRTYLDLLEPAVFVNHSCNPNAGIRGLVLTALTPIVQDTEIFYDYSTTMDEDYWTLRCACGTAQCRGIVTDFKYLPPDLQEKYLRLNIVQDFIVSQRQTLREALA